MLLKKRKKNKKEVKKNLKNSLIKREKYKKRGYHWNNRQSGEMLICGANTQINHDIQDKYHETGQQISKVDELIATT